MYTIIDGEQVDLGVAYGYCYQPQVIGQRGETARSYSPIDGEWNIHPYFDTAAEAVQWLVDRGVAGEVMRFAHDKPVDKRGDDYSPWVTSGVVATVDGETLYEKLESFRAAVEWARKQGERFRNV